MKLVSSKMRRSRIFWLASIILGALLLWSAGIPVVQAADAQWTATYWNNTSLSGSAVLQRMEDSVDYDWGDNSPDPAVNVDQFSARWTRAVYFSAGSYRFTATMDDGLRFWIDGVLVIDSWWDSQVHSLSYDAYLNAGDHDLKVEYYDAGGKAVAKLTWTGIGGTAPTPIGHWKGDYFNNTGLVGAAVLTRDDVSIDFDWGIGSPQWGVVGSDQFSARWTRDVLLQPARYRFVVTADDGARLWVNNILIIDEWHDAGPVVYEAEIDLPGGSIPIKMEYYENVGGAVARLGWVQVSTGPWHGEYFNNTTLTGTPALIRDDGAINFNWGSGSPDPVVNTDNFSVRWNRTVNLAAGRYRFTATSDDGVRAYVDGQLVVDGWSTHQSQTFNGERDLSSGNHNLVVEYFEGGGGASVNFSFSVISSPTPVPPYSGATGTVLVYRLNVRSGPGTTNSVVGTLSRGDVVPLAGYRSENALWVMISWQGGTAWVSAQPIYLLTNVLVDALPVWQGTTAPSSQQPALPASGDLATVANCYLLNMRAGPGVSYTILDTLPVGTVVELLGRNATASWAKVRLTDGSVGWMSTRYLNASIRFSTLPLTE